VSCHDGQCGSQQERQSPVPRTISVRGGRVSRISGGDEGPSRLLVGCLINKVIKRQRVYHDGMRKPQEFSIDDSSARTLRCWLQSTTLPQGQITRAKIILALHAGKTPSEVADEQSVSCKTVHKWRNRFVESGVDGLLDEQRPGRPPTLDRKIIDRVLTLTTQYVPEEATQWSERLMAAHAAVTPYQVRKIWKAADLQPHRLKTFKISNDPQFAEKVVDIVGLYMNPPSNAVVLSVDEKTQIQALDRTQPGLPLSPGRIGSDPRLQATWDYKPVRGFQHSDWTYHRSSSGTNPGQRVPLFSTPDRSTPPERQRSAHHSRQSQRP
jgi:transposase